MLAAGSLNQALDSAPYDMGVRELDIPYRLTSDCQPIMLTFDCPIDRHVTMW